MPKALILHFNSIERYPPATNVAEHLKSTGMDVKVVTTAVGNTPASQGMFTKLKLTWELAKFHLGAMVALTFESFDLVIAYEHLSILPIQWTRKTNPNQRLWLHFHEYTSPAEIACAGAFSSHCWKHVPAVVERSDFTSHTNGWRLNRFRSDMRLNALTDDRFGCIPNTPPQAWLDHTPTQWNSPAPTKRPLRLVYHGALHPDTTYIERLCELLDEGNGELTLDVFTNDNIDDISSAHMKVHPSVPYMDLPKVLTEFDLGLIIYRGIIPNHQFSQPNKLWEYLGCKLPVVVTSNLDDSMISPEMSGRVAKFDFQAGSFQALIQTMERLLGGPAGVKVEIEPFEFHLDQVIQRLHL